MNDIDTDCPCSTPCTSCGCSECGELETGTLGPLTLPSGRVVQACAACREAGEEEETVEEVTVWDPEMLKLKEVI